MSSPSQEQPEALLLALDSLSDVLRLRMIGILAEAELSVGEMCDVLSSAQSTVSRHLKLLTEAGWLVCRREGTSRHYQLAEPLPETLAGLRYMVRERLADWPQAQEDVRRVARILRQRQVEGFFTHAARDWARRREEYYGRLFHAEALLGMLPRQWHVADFGCATGELTVPLARHVDQVTAIDVLPEMVQATAQRTSDMRHVTCLQADLTELPVEDNIFDAALCVLVMAYLPDIGAFLDEAHRVLKPGGRLVLIDAAPYQDATLRQQMGQVHAGLAREDMEKACRKAGLTVHGYDLPADLDARLSALWLIHAVV